MSLYLKKLKIKLLFKLLIFVLCIISIIRFLIFNITYKLNINDGLDKGIITSITKKEDYTVLNIKSKINYRAYISNNNGLNIGDIIKFKYINKNVDNNTIFNIFNYKKYLKSKNIKQVISIKQYKKINTNKLYRFKGKLFDYILSKKSKNYILTFLYGDKNSLDIDVKYSYNNNGISHLLCVSGFHIVFIFNLLNRFIKKIFNNNNVFNIIILLIISFIYLFLTNYMIALFRAILMYFFIYFNKKFNININSIYYFFITLFLSVSMFPNELYNVGFYYTFILTFFLLTSKYDLNNIFKVSIYLYIVSMPITIYLNYSINLLSILYSILFSFFVCYILYPLSFLALFFGFFDFILYKLSLIFESVNLYLDNINIFRIVFCKTNIFIIIFIYITLFIFIYTKYKYLFIFNVLLLLYMIFGKYLNSNTYIYFIDVKQGDMSLIINKHYNSVTLIDTGGIINNKYLKYSVKQFLYSKGIDKIDNLILSHGDFDHMGEAINLVNNIKVEKVVFNCGAYNDLEKELIKVLDKKKIKYYSCIKELSIDKNKLYFLQTKEYDNENDNSNVIYTDINNYKFMFMGDASTITEKEIMSKYNLTNIDVLKVGHHGSKTSSSEDFIDKINPRYSVISVGKNNRYGHPNKEVLENLNNSKIYRTDEVGSIMFKIKNSKLKIDTCSP